ncbi:AAA family ATPase [Klebsiella pneumoniae]|uniref:AAA family ATPase n=1 Tax=Klebsiella pneumoniae TaxID=573 RepID=UPI003A90D8ED
MKIEKIKLQNFRCFGHEVVELNFEEELTILVGGNGSGKTAVLQAVSRLFGTSSAQRSVQREIFTYLLAGRSCSLATVCLSKRYLPSLNWKSKTLLLLMPFRSSLIRWRLPVREGPLRPGYDYKQHGRMTVRRKEQLRRIYAG